MRSLRASVRSFGLALALALPLLACGSAPAPACPPAPPPPPPLAPAPCPEKSAPVAAATSASAPASSSAPPPAPPPPSAPPKALADAVDAATTALAANDLAAADKQLALATSAAGDDPHLAYLVARAKATRFAVAADFEHAAAAYGAVIPALAKRPDLQDEFWAHNAMMMIRAAQGDPAAALAENDQATLAAARGTWEPEQREMLAFQKDRWHRAYLTRMLAESRTGSAKDALVRYAQAALDDYRPKGFPDSIAVLEAYFAALDHNREAALAAAKRVDPEKNGDVEDLYLVVVGLEAGGDHASAEAVRHIMRRPGPPRVSRAVMLRWLDLDAKKSGFTPWHATQR
jgi:hypothetical protein